MSGRDPITDPADVYDLLLEFGLWRRSHERCDEMAHRLANQLSRLDLESLFTEAVDIAKAKDPAAMVATWLESDWKVVIDERRSRLAAFVSNGPGKPKAASGLDEAGRGPYNHQRIMEERLETFARLHPEHQTDAEMRRAFLDQDIRTCWREKGMARTCDIFRLTKHEVEQACERYYADQNKQLLPAEFKFVDLIPKEKKREALPPAPAG